LKLLHLFHGGKDAKGNAARDCGDFGDEWLELLRPFMGGKDARRGIEGKSDAEVDGFLFVHDFSAAEAVVGEEADVIAVVPEVDYDDLIFVFQNPAAL